MLDEFKVERLIRKFDGKTVEVKIDYECDYLAECVACEFSNTLASYLKSVTNAKVIVVGYDGVERTSILNDVYYDVFVELEVNQLSVKVNVALFLVNKRVNSLTLSTYISSVDVVTFDDELKELLNDEI